MLINDKLTWCVCNLFLLSLFYAVLSFLWLLFRASCLVSDSLIMAVYLLLERQMIVLCVKFFVNLSDWVSDSIIDTLVHSKLSAETQSASEHPACDKTVCWRYELRLRKWLSIEHVIKQSVLKVRAETEEIVDHRTCDKTKCVEGTSWDWRNSWACDKTKCVEGTSWDWRNSWASNMS